MDGSAAGAGVGPRGHVATRRFDWEVEMGAVEPLRVGGSHDNGAMEAQITPLRPSGLGGAVSPEHRSDLRPAGHRFTRAQSYEGATALIFSHLFEPLDEGLPDGGSTVLPAALAAADVEDDPEGMYLLAAALLGARRIGQAAASLRRLDAATAHRSDQWLWRGRAEFLWAVQAERTADASATLQHCHAAAQIMGGTPQSTPPHHAHGRHDFLRTVDAVVSAQLPLLAARAHIRLGDSGQAQTILSDRFGTQERAEASQPATLSMLACRQGRLRDAFRLATAALQTVREPDGACELVDINARLVRAEVSFEHNELDAAQEELNAALHLCSTVAAPHWMWVVEADLIRVMIAQRRATEALHRLEHLRQVAGSGLSGHPASQNLDQLEIDCRLALGDLEGARLVAGSSASPDVSCETLARIDLHSGRPDAALSRVGAGGSPVPATHIRRLVLLACAERQQGRARRAHDTLRRAVVAAQPERYVRPFLEEATQTLPLLRGLLTSSPDPYLSELVSHADGLSPAVVIKEAPIPLEPLTERERQVLRYLPSHLNQHQIAKAMYVSPNTVKTHVKAIYRKTGTSSRHDAVTTARSHGLL